MKKDEITLRLQRVLNGSRNVEDLNRIFNWLRFRSHGEQAIKEIGDFAAHQERRDQGITWKRASDIFHNARLFLGVVEADQKGQHLELTKEQFGRSLRASLELLGPAEIKNGTGFGMKKARQLVASVVAKAGTKSSPPATAEENRVVDYAARRFSPEPVLTQESLIASLSAVLTKEHLIEPGDRPRLEAQSDYITVYAISIMHLCEVDLGGGDTGILEAGVTPEGLLILGARMDKVLASQPSLGMGTPLFTTSCRAEDWCERSPDAPWGSTFTWSSPLELSPEGRLAEMD